MAHGVSEVLGKGSTVKMVHQKQEQSVAQQQNVRKSVGVMGSRRIFSPSFKLQVLDSYRNDIDCRGNQRATARKYGIHRRQIQKWLQCEDNLRNSCAETANNSVSTTVISPTGVSKSAEGGATETAGSTVTPAAPALNLSLARLHGDELATQQGPPPLLSHPSHRDGSPSSPHYASQSGTSPPVLPVRLGYQEYLVNGEQHRLRRETEERVQVTVDVHGYPEARVDQESNYYALNSDGQREFDGFEGRNETKVYQTLTAYRVPQEQRYESNETLNRSHRSPPHGNRHLTSQQNYGNVDTPIDGKLSYGLLLVPSMIKTERASPDSAATPGPCEPMSSPGFARVPLSPVSHSTNNGTGSSSVVSSVHFDSPRASAHASPTPDSENLIPSHQRESTTIVGEKGTEIAEETEIGKASIKQEIRPKEEAFTAEEGKEPAVASSYVDYQRPPATATLTIADSCPVSPVYDREGYSSPSSPRGPASSGRSSISCSDSEMDPLDCSSGSHNSSNDLARRRSFSLRFKLDVLDAFHRDVGVAGNQRATARKFGINRRQVQKWLGQETELRGEIALHGNARQRLGPIQDAASGDSPVDLRTSNYVSCLSQDRIEGEYERSPLYCCDVGSSSLQHLTYYQHTATMDATSESEPPCYLSCCASTAPCYHEVSLRGSCYSDSQTGLYCYSPGEYSSEIASVPEHSDELSSPYKRQHCTLSCCLESLPSPKRLCLEVEERLTTTRFCRDAPPQETPLCLVKPKRLADASPSRTEPVTSTVPTPPVSVAPISLTTNKKDAILFKPYLDNPVSKPAKEQRGLSPISSQNVNNNNNCQNICNLNEGRGHDYALELSLRLPVSWRSQPTPYTDFPRVNSAFVRYPASPHYS